MSFWSWLFPASPTGVTPNANPAGVPPTVGGLDYSPGDPDGVELDTTRTFTRALPFPQPSGWDGWPASWAVPQWDFGSRFNELVDVAWTCLDLNANVLSAMPVYRTRGGQVIEPVTWMSNPDPSIYTSWHEFAKQLFWDYQLGEAFVLPVARSITTGYPLTFRVIPPWMMHAEMRGGVRTYRLGGSAGPDVSDEVLHIRYKSTVDNAHGVGPLESAGGRMLTAGLLAKYVREVVSTGGLVQQTLETEQDLSDGDAQDVLSMWLTSRALNPSAPPVLDNDLKLVDHHAMSPKELAMLEIAQFTEARIAVLLGVPPTLVALPSGGTDTYKNVQQVFDFHDRASLKVKATHVMSAVSDWALPSTQRVELNRDEYTRPSFETRAAAWVQLVQAGIVTPEEVRVAERFAGPVPVVAITGGDNDPIPEGVEA